MYQRGRGTASRGGGFRGGPNRGGYGGRGGTTAGEPDPKRPRMMATSQIPGTSKARNPDLDAEDEEMEGEDVIDDLELNVDDEEGVDVVSTDFLVATGEDEVEYTRREIEPDLLTKDISFQIVDIDNYVANVVPPQHYRQYTPAASKKSVIRLYGVNESGNSFMVHIHDFLPYMYVEAPEYFHAEHCGAFKVSADDVGIRAISVPFSCVRTTQLLFRLFQQRTLANHLTGEGYKGPWDTMNVVQNVELVSKQNLYGYHKDLKPFIKITVLLPKQIPVLRRLLEGGIAVPPANKREMFVKVYEANIEFVVRFMCDLKISGCSWVTLPRGKYTVRKHADNDNANGSSANNGNSASTKLDLYSLCQVELDCRYDSLIAHAPEGEWLKIAPLRLLSFDIECHGRRGIFPEPEKDPIIQIACLVQVFGERDPCIRTIFCLNDTAPVSGVEVRCCETEAELLDEWARFVRATDPDVITGYNIQNFDIPYIIDRAAALAKQLKSPTPADEILKTRRMLGQVPFLGRLRTSITHVRKAMVQSKQMGRRENKYCNTEGRMQFDMLQVLLRDYKLRSYTLNAVSFHFLDQQKEDVPHTAISELFLKNRQTRQRLAVYCLKDAWLPLRLLDKLMSLVNYIEMARVTGVPLSYLLSRGQQIKVVSQLMRLANEKNLLLPVYKGEVGDVYEGATVLDAMAGYYDEPIATLDFTSLYPSIMIAYNLCYTTLLSNEAKNRLDPKDFIRTPSGHCFVKKELREGLLPEILENLLAARKRAKAELKSETDPFRRSVLDGRQLALKISANSVYGFTGAQVGKLPCLEISSSVTAFGRNMIDLSKKTVEEHYTVENGYEHKAVVIYGDTDSIMVKFGSKTPSSSDKKKAVSEQDAEKARTETIVQAMKLGAEAAKVVSGQFPPPIKLEFEKVYFPYLLISKKRYAGLYWTRPDKSDKMDCKGIETVRRDNCPLVANVMDMCLRKILVDRKPAAARDYAKKIISDLLCNRIDISQLIITKELTKKDDDYANKQPHVVLAEKMRKRDAGSAPQLGDRIPYVITAEGGKTARAYEKAEDPLYVLNHGIAIDTQYYLDNQLAKPLVRLFDPILKQQGGAESVLLHGEHTLLKTKSVAKNNFMDKFMKKSTPCPGCNGPLPDDGKALCAKCLADAPVVCARQMTNASLMQEEYHRLWTECQNCVGDAHTEVICTNRDCPIFYQRLKTRFDLEKLSARVAAFAKLTPEDIL